VNIKMLIHWKEDAGCDPENFGENQKKSAF
jgi:hypothetical protein